MAQKSCCFGISNLHSDQLLQLGMTYGSLLHELQVIWDEVGESDAERDKLLLELEQESLELYRSKINQANWSRMKLRQAIADSQKELSAICFAMGEQVVNIEQDSASLKEQLTVIVPQLEEMRKRKFDRLNQFLEVTEQIWKISEENFKPEEYSQTKRVMDESDVSLGRLEEQQRQLQTLKREKVEAEVLRLEKLKAGKMKEVVLKKRSELEEIYRLAHMVPETEATEHAIIAIESGAVDSNYILEQVEAHISKVKEEAFSRKEIVIKVHKWLAACEEERWLEKYNEDEKRYDTGRDTHLRLKHAEKARATVTKLPAIVEVLVSKTTAWEKAKGTGSIYDGVQLLSMLEEYNVSRQRKAQEHQRQQDQKRSQWRVIAEQEAVLGSNCSHLEQQTAKKVPRNAIGSANRRLSHGGAMFQLLPNQRSAVGAVVSRPTRKRDQLQTNDSLNSQQEDGFGLLSTGRRGIDVPDHPVKQHSLNACEVEAPVQRKPFSPHLALSSNSTDTINIQQGRDKSFHGHSQKKFPVNNIPTTIPSKQTSVLDEENRSPEVVAIPVPKTPLTVSIPMQTVMTPGPIFVRLGTMDARMLVETEYSFEEVRAGYVVPVKCS